MSDDLRKRALDLYKGPFRFDGITYLWDGNGEMVADSQIEEDVVGPRVRGWGRIGYLPDNQALFKETGNLLAEALTIGWKVLRARDASKPFEQMLAEAYEAIRIIGTGKLRDAP